MICGMFLWKRMNCPHLNHSTQKNTLLFKKKTWKLYKLYDFLFDLKPFIICCYKNAFLADRCLIYRGFNALYFCPVDLLHVFYLFTDGSRPWRTQMLLVIQKRGRALQNFLFLSEQRAWAEDDDLGTYFWEITANFSEKYLHKPFRLTMLRNEWL